MATTPSGESNRALRRGADPDSAASAARPMKSRDEPIYTISIAARLVRPLRGADSSARPLHAQTLRTYEREGLVKPQRVGRNRLYSDSDIDRLQQIQHLTHDRGVNLAGVEIILELMEQVRAMEVELDRFRK